MTLIPPRISDALWRVVPAPLANKLRSTVVKRFIRFAPAAFCAVAATQITYIICLGPANLTAGVAGFAGWFAGAAVSYVISRWAWERKGRPHLLKETLPFVAVSIGAGIILTLASKFGNGVAKEMGLDGRGPGPRGRHVLLRGELPDVRAAVPYLPLRPVRRPEGQGRHPGRRRGPGAGHGRARGDRHHPRARPRAGAPRRPRPVRRGDGPARVNGMSAWANGSAGQPAVRHGEVDASPAPERGTRR